MRRVMFTVACAVLAMLVAAIPVLAATNVTDVYVGLQTPGGPFTSGLSHFTYNAGYSLDGHTNYGAGVDVKQIEVNSAGTIYATATDNTLNEWNWNGSTFANTGGMGGASIADFALGTNDEVYAIETTALGTVKIDRSNPAFTWSYFNSNAKERAGLVGEIATSSDGSIVVTMPGFETDGANFGWIEQFEDTGSALNPTGILPGPQGTDLGVLGLDDTLGKYWIADVNPFQGRLVGANRTAASLSGASLLGSINHGAAGAWHDIDFLSDGTMVATSGGGAFGPTLLTTFDPATGNTISSTGINGVSERTLIDVDENDVIHLMGGGVLQAWVVNSGALTFTGDALVNLGPSNGLATYNIPEPMTMVLLGLGGLFIRRRRV